MAPLQRDVPVRCTAAVSRVDGRHQAAAAEAGQVDPALAHPLPEAQLHHLAVPLSERKHTAGHGQPALAADAQPSSRFHMLLFAVGDNFSLPLTGPTLIKHASHKKYRILTFEIASRLYR